MQTISPTYPAPGSLARNVEAIRIEDFDYPLPDRQIARHPLAKRDACRLLVADASGIISHRIFSDLPALIKPGSLMIANETRVINARMKFFRPSGAAIEVFLLEPSLPSDYVLSFAEREKCQWVCMVGNLKKWKEPTLSRRICVKGVEDPVELSVRLLPLADGETSSASRRVEFSWDNNEATFADIVEAAGNIPIPPYLKRDSEESDLSDYQTVYSRVDGSVAAPTAGLHFTPELFSQLDARGVTQRKVTLHVGAGTFQPVKADEIGGHAMHTESIVVERRVIADIIAALEAGRDIVAVGTTSVRTLESLPLFGFLVSNGADPADPAAMHVEQWRAYNPDFMNVDTLTLLRTLLEAMSSRNLDFITGSTSIMIAPGFRWRIANRLITNFHQPQSTLLLLVSSFLGLSPEEIERARRSGHPAAKEDELLWKRIYAEALAAGYRFLSYGDACLFTRQADAPEVSAEAE